MSEVVEMQQPLGLFAGQLLQRAGDYLAAFKILSEQPTFLPFPAYFLAAHALELYFKSFLAANGTSKHGLKRFGHNLQKLAVACAESQMPPVDVIEWWIPHFDEMNGDHDFRYPSNYNLSMPKPAECIAFLEGVCAAVTPTVSHAALSAELQHASDTRHLRGHKIRWSD